MKNIFDQIIIENLPDFGSEHYKSMMKEFFGRKEQNNVVFERNTGVDKKLITIETTHTYDPNSSLFQMLSEQIKYFNQLPGKKLIVIESTQDIEKTYKENRDQILEGGEMLFMQAQAIKYRIPYICFEINTSNEIPLLVIENFSYEELFYFYMIRLIGQWVRSKSEIQLEHYLSNTVKIFKRFDEQKYSYIQFNRLHEQYFGLSLENTDKKLLEELSRPTKNHFISNEIAIKLGNIREGIILDGITKKLESETTYYVFTDVRMS